MRDGHKRKSIFRLSHTVFCGQLDYDRIGVFADNCQADKRPGSEPEISQTGDALTEMIDFLEDERERGETQVKVGIIDTHQDREGENNRTDEEELEWPL